MMMVVWYGKVCELVVMHLFSPLLTEPTETDNEEKNVTFSSIEIDKERG